MVPFFLVIAKWQFSKWPVLSVLIVGLLNVVLCMWIVVSVLRLKSFIWSLYQAVLVTIAADDELEKTNNRDNESQV